MTSLNVQELIDRATGMDASHVSTCRHILIIGEIMQIIGERRQNHAGQPRVAVIHMKRRETDGRRIIGSITAM